MPALFLSRKFSLEILSIAFAFSSQRFREHVEYLQNQKAVVLHREGLVSPRQLKYPPLFPLTFPIVDPHFLQVMAPEK